MGKKSSKENMQPAIDAPALAEGMDDQEQGKRTAKATVFTDLFSDPEYRLQLAQSLHPEMELTLKDVILLTLSNVLLDNPYNDLGLLVGNKLLILVEAVREAIRICKDKNVLKEYLEEREGEVIDMMITLFDQETIRENYVAARVREAVEEADREAAAKAEKAAREAAAEAAAEADKTARVDENLIRIKSLMANMKLSAQDAMTALNIPPAQQAIYLKHL